jgi:hypothetical protein
MISRLSSLLLLLLATLGIAQQPPTTPTFQLEKDIAVPMRDGVLLRADVLRPKAEGRFPTLVYRTPYGKEFALKEYTTFQHAVERGYAVVVQDVRGRYASAGEFVPYQNEGHDGYDTIEWAARQSWSNGAIGTFGLSYPGAVQWLAAVETPPHLKAMVPAMTFSTPQNFFYSWGLWDMSWMEWIWDNIAPDVRVKKNLPGPKTYDEAVAEWPTVSPKMLGTVPLNQLEELRGIAPYYYNWLSHPADDPWWDWCELRNKYARNHAAVLNFSAWYDDNYGPEGATTNFAGLLKARAGKDPQTHLLLGPWVHGVGSTGKSKAGDREFSPEAAINYDEVVLSWMDHFLRGQDNGVNKAKAVRYFVMGDDQWRDADSWPPAAESKSYYLHSATKDASTASLSPDLPSDPGGATAFISDPSHPLTNPYSSSGAHDYRDLVKRNDVLTFDSAPVEKDTEVTGPIQADIYFSCDCRDTDLWVRLLDVDADGRALNLMSPGLDVQRASYRNIKAGRQLLTAGSIYELRLDHLITSNVFKQGHRIRVQISGTFFPNFSRNLQSGELENTSANMQKANIRIYTERKHASRVILPVVTR